MLIFNTGALGVVVVAPRVIAMLIEITRMLQIDAPIRVWQECNMESSLKRSGFVEGIHLNFDVNRLLKVAIYNYY